ncbi:MAG: hypothetical protein V1789_08195 [PVC group bacterium]
MFNYRSAWFYHVFFKKRFSTVILLLLLAVELIVWGILLGENKETMRNAHYLCLDCLGIG